MKHGLLSTEAPTILHRGTSLVPLCGACKLYLGCKSPKMPVWGKGKRKVLVIGEGPGETEDQQNRPFVGKTGLRLRHELGHLGVDLADCWVTNSIICFPGDVRVQSPSPISKVFQRRYTGLFVCIHTLNGRTLTGTPNHPILTTQGWIPLGQLIESQYLICCDLGQRAGLSGTDIDNPPPTIEQVFQASLKFGHLERMIGSRVDFHGDGKDSNVNIITPYGFLRDWNKAPLNEQESQFAFMLANETTVDFSGDSCQLDSFGNFPDRFLASFHGTMSSSNEFSPSFGANLLHANSQGTTTITQWNSSTLENQTKTTERYTKGMSEWFQCLPGVVTTDRVVKIEWQSSDQFFYGNNASKRSGHVYNLETGQGYYTANGIVVSNCRSPGNATPTDAQIEYCRPNLLRIIQEKKPEIIILLGSPAVRSIIGYLWRENSGGIERWQGWQIPCQKWNCWICPTFHPSYVEREKAPVLDLMFHEHLKRAFAHKSRPWKTVPDYLEKCRFVYDPQEAVNVIATMIFSVKSIAIAFDYETSSLKPDDSDSKIICCSVSDGNESVAFLWKGVVIEAMKGFLSSNIPKIASNLKFETRWSLAKLGIEPKNWLWDTMLAAHLLDNRPHISSIKFQAFALLGQPPWDEQVKPYMEPKGDDQKKFGDNAKNQLHKVDPKTLGVYCAADSLFEWHVAKKQMNLMGVKT